MLKLFFLSFSMVFLSCVPSGDGDRPLKNIQYGATTVNQLDVYVPDGVRTLCPVVIFIPGGKWCFSNREEWWRESKINLFKEIGFISVAIDYRLSPYPYELDNSKRIMHPVHVQDVAAAIKWVKDHIRDYNGDPKQIFIMGHSAGAHLAGLVATNECFLKEQGLSLKIIKGVCLLDAGAYLIGDKKLLFPSDTEHVSPNYIDLKYAYLNAFGQDSLMWSDATPYEFLLPNKNIPPFLLIYGEDPLRAKPNTKFIQRMEYLGYHVTGFCAAGYDHLKIFNSLGTSEDTIGETDTIIHFFKTNIR